jgi:hypothetical protein
MGHFLQRLLSFERLIGPRLVKIVYFFGAAIIVFAFAGALLASVFAIAGGNVGGGLMRLIAAPVVGAVAFVYWRFICELFMLAFLAYERMGEMRDLLARGSAASGGDPEHPAF